MFHIFGYDGSSLEIGHGGCVGSESTWLWRRLCVSSWGWGFSPTDAIASCPYWEACQRCTAMEDVSDQLKIIFYFQWVQQWVTWGQNMLGSYSLAASWGWLRNDHNGHLSHLGNRYYRAQETLASNGWFACSVPNKTNLFFVVLTLSDVFCCVFWMRKPM